MHSFVRPRVRNSTRHFLHSASQFVAIGLGLAVCHLLMTSHSAAQDSPKQFRAGAATSNITPWLGVSINGGMSDRKATHVHDELHARCLVLDDGKTRLAFAVCDMCMIPREVMDEAKAMVHRETSMPVENILISATHTHEAPTAAGVFQSDPDPGFPEFLAKKIADGVRRATTNLEPAKIGWGVGKVPGQVFNRRWFMKPGFALTDPFGRGTDKVRMNPPVSSPELDKPAGPTDPDVSILSVQSKDGRPIALLANYSLHYVGDAGPGAISADYYGMFADRIEQLLGANHFDPPFVGIMSNGTSGNINNVNFRTAQPRPPTYGKMRQVAHDVADEALRVTKTITHRDDITLDVRTAKLELGVRRPTKEELAKGEDLLAQAKSEKRELKGVDEIYARESVLINKYPEKVQLILEAMRIGDLAITAIPCEVFVEIGLELKEKSPFNPTFTIELANGYNGYLPTPEHHALGGYETWRARSSYLEVDASPKITATLFQLLADLQKAR